MESLGGGGGGGKQLEKRGKGGINNKKNSKPIKNKKIYIKTKKLLLFTLKKK